MKLYQHQKLGAEWLSSRKTALLAWEMGCGKSATAIAACDRVKADRILILCPAVAKTMWSVEFGRFQNIDRPVSVIHKATQAVPATGVVIANYDLISRTDTYLLKRLMAQTWDVVIADEAHSLKSRKANRTQAVYGKRCDRKNCIAEVARHFWLLTGTPMPSNASELWTHLRALAPDSIMLAPDLPMSEHQFIDKFCTWRDTPFGRQITGSRHLPDLRERMKNFMDRKKKTEVLTSLPSLAFDTLVVQAHDCNHVPASVLRELGTIEMNIASTVSGSGDEILDVLNSLKTNAHITTQRRLTGLIKAEIALDVIGQHIRGSDRKLIVFAHHTAVIDRLMAGLADMGAGAVKIDGRDDTQDRDAAVSAFQNDPLTRVFVGQLDAAGTAITLTAASDVLFVEASWVPATNAQCAARAHRIGQKDAVLARFLTLDGSLDRQIMTAIARKSRDIAELIDNETTTTENSNN
jgi:SNF2 family DNA or RNA helicase